LYSILYPVIAEPPLLDGADQDKLTSVGETAKAVRLVGAVGTLKDDVDFGCARLSTDGS
jgi:hypothetical protein